MARRKNWELVSDDKALAKLDRMRSAIWQSGLVFSTQAQRGMDERGITVEDVRHMLVTTRTVRHGFGPYGLDPDGEALTALMIVEHTRAIVVAVFR